MVSAIQGQWKQKLLKLFSLQHLKIEKVVHSKFVTETNTLATKLNVGSLKKKHVSTTGSSDELFKKK